MTVNGRPVFALRGPVPMYRALGPGTSGDDVKQLQKALRRLGFDPGSISGTYGQGTATAVTDWYRNKGYEAQQPSADGPAATGPAATGGVQPRRRRSSPPSGRAVRHGRGRTGARARSELAASAPVQESADSYGPESSTDRQVQAIQLGSAQKALDMANAALSTFQATYGTKVPAGEVVFFPQLPVRLDKATVKAGDAPRARSAP